MGYRPIISYVHRSKEWVKCHLISTLLFMGNGKSLHIYYGSLRSVNNGLPAIGFLPANYHLYVMPSVCHVFEIRTRQFWDCRSYF